MDKPITINKSDLIQDVLENTANTIKNELALNDTLNGKWWNIYFKRLWE